MSDQVAQLATLRGELREEKEVVAALEESKADCERLLSKKIEELVNARKQRDEELRERLEAIRPGIQNLRGHRVREQMVFNAAIESILNRLDSIFEEADRG